MATTTRREIERQPAGPRAECASRRRLALLGWGGRGEEVDEQLIDAFSLVVMNPMRRVRQALDAVEVGHVVAAGSASLGPRKRSRCPQMTSVGDEIGRIAALAFFGGVRTEQR
jgi:hypothetical protein